MAHLQTGILTINLAILTFIGASELQQENPPVYALYSAVILFVALTLYVFGLYAQWRWTLRGAREQFDLSQRVLTYIHENNEQYVNKLPKELNETKKGKTNTKANRLIITSLFLTFAGAVFTLYSVYDRIVFQ